MCVLNFARLKHALEITDLVFLFFLKLNFFYPVYFIFKKSFLFFYLPFKNVSLILFFSPDRVKMLLTFFDLGNSFVFHHVSNFFAFDPNFLLS